MALISGQLIAKRILVQTQARIAESGVTPGLAVILVGDYIESEKYVALKEARAQEIGVRFEKHLFPAQVTPQELYETLGGLNARSDIHGILVQLPLPEGLPTDDIIAHIDPKKDTDGFHEETMREFLAGKRSACPVFPQAIIELIRETGISFRGERAVAVVNSALMGKVLSFALSLEGLAGEYIVSSEGHEAIALKTRGATVVVTACGIPDLITADMLSPDAIIIDGGNVHVDSKVQGDIHRASVEPKVAFLSPVPGGVGPVTVATLLSRVTDVALESRVR